MKDEAPTHTRVSPTEKEKSPNNQRTNWKLKLRKEEINNILFKKKMNAESWTKTHTHPRYKKEKRKPDIKK